ncbi:uncharacterized protein TNCV_1280641 [Trichonephila clavipes]|nr:uncharacterized protein TNCV_1280641 [Trichonephila clavipes]
MYASRCSTDSGNPYFFLRQSSCGRGSRVVKISDRGWLCHEFEPSTAKDPPCSAAMHVKSVESSSILPLVGCGCQERVCVCRPRHLTMVQNYGVGRQKPSCS